VDEESAYWTDGLSNAVWSAPLGGGTPTPLAVDLVNPTDIEVDENAVYVNDLEGTFRIPRGGGAIQALAWGSGRGLAEDTANVYAGTADGRLLQIPKVGGTATELAKTELFPNDIAVDDEYVYWIEGAAEGALVRIAK